METVAVNFLISRSDVLQPSLFTAKSNDPTYSCWRQIHQEFTIKKLIRIVDKKYLKMKSIFYSLK